MNVIYGVPAVPKTFKLSLARLNNPMKHFQKIIVETVFESSKTFKLLLTRLKQSNETKGSKCIPQKLILLTSEYSNMLKIFDFGICVLDT